MNFLLKCIITSNALKEISIAARSNENYLSDFSMNWQNFIASSYVYFIVPESESATIECFEITYLKRLNRLFYYSNFNFETIDFEKLGRHIVIVDSNIKNSINQNALTDNVICSDSIKEISIVIQSLMMNDSYSKKSSEPVFNKKINLPIRTLIYHDQYFIDQINSEKTKQNILLLISNLISLNKSKINNKTLNVFFIGQWAKTIKYDIASVLHQIEKDFVSKYKIGIKFHYLMSNPHHRIFLSDYFFAISPNTMTKKINIKIASIIGDSKEFIENINNIKETAKEIKNQFFHDVLKDLSPFSHPIIIERQPINSPT